MTHNRKEFRTSCNPSKGFSTLELLIVMAISFIIAALAIPGYNTIRRTLRIAGDGRDLNGTINEAKLQAASGFTRARMYADLAGNSFHIDVWNKAAGCWQTVSDPNNPCTVLGTSPVQKLSPGVTFGWGNVGAPPPNTQAQLLQGTVGAGGCGVRNGIAYGVVTNTACIDFNSRGIPISPKTGTPLGGDAIYITDNNTVYAITVGATGVTQIWTIGANGSGSWQHR
jgi:type II secretory pathway pseudopilin PulG